MIKRIIDISERTYIHTRNKQLILEKEGDVVATLPIEDLGLVVLHHPATVISQNAFVLCQQSNVVLMICDEKHMPCSVNLPIFDTNSLHSKVIRQQIALKKPVKKQLWKGVVQEKIKQQSQTLKVLGKSSTLLKRMVGKVKSGDKMNHEAQAARHYWPMLYGQDFRRDKDASGLNQLLNFGYAIIRAMVARAIVGTGLHPALGISHSNQYNSFCLADDLMEPFRPWVDLKAWQLVEEGGVTPEINQETKACFLGLLHEPVGLLDRHMSLWVACHYLAANFRLVCQGERNGLDYPSLHNSN